jgi:hypothetical protein
MADRNALSRVRIQPNLMRLWLMKKQLDLADSGEVLDEVTRSEMESLFGYELKDIRIHQTKQAGELAQRLEADAFTIGSHIFSSEGKLSSFSESRGLLAHEITHVIQQTHPKHVTPAFGKKAQMEIAGPEIEFVHAPQFASSSVGSTSGVEQTETAAQAMEERASNADENETTTKSVDAEEIAEYVYQLMQQDLLLEKERARR